MQTRSKNVETMLLLVEYAIIYEKEVKAYLCIYARNIWIYLLSKYVELPGRASLNITKMIL